MSPFPPAEAAAWLGREAGPRPVTLAELYALRTGRRAADAGSQPAATGQYL